MPAWQKQLIKDQNGIIKTLQYGPEPEITLLIMSNESYNIIPALQLLSGADPNVKRLVFQTFRTHHDDHQLTPPASHTATPRPTTCTSKPP